MADHLDAGVAGLTGEELAARTGVAPERIERLVALGILAPGDAAAPYSPADLQRVRLAEAIERSGISLDDVGRAIHEGLISFGFVETVFDDPHWFWSDQYQHNLQYMGFATEWEHLVVRGSLEERSFVAFYLAQGVVKAVVGLDRGKDVRRSAGLIRARRPFAPSLLRDEDVDLKNLATQAAEGV